ncbi:50 kDa hatching enzyme-like [Mytilus californianus]|uniref:50 kDa hatching enzyme-like n=1 Tax=Mytilus californianus TaxID=6549 RepID=UPI00224857BF|nr:50 kDa hatching enzyme-like [Mytilus californianus]
MLNDSPDRQTKQMLITFQEYNHLPVTGELDNKTVKLMNTPRCGMQDKPTPHGMPLAFSGGIITHAWYPPDGRLHFDDAEAWDVGGNGANLFPICAHAIGHILGLGHSNVPGSMMYPWDPATGNPAATLSPDDLAGIQSSFGPEVPTTTQLL